MQYMEYIMNFKIRDFVVHSCYLIIILLQIFLLVALVFYGHDIYAKYYLDDKSNDAINIIYNFFGVVFATCGIVGILIFLYNVYAGNKEEMIIGLAITCISFLAIKFLKLMHIIIEIKLMSLCIFSFYC